MHLSISMVKNTGSQLSLFLRSAGAVLSVFLLLLNLGFYLLQFIACSSLLYKVTILSCISWACVVGNRHVMIGHQHMEAISTTK
jgi:hypothetical protein